MKIYLNYIYVPMLLVLNIGFIRVFHNKYKFENLKHTNYSVLYYYNMNANVVLETTNGTYEPKESDLVFINNNYKHMIKKNIGTFDILRFKFY
jgi:hypothetical protein